MSQAQKVTLTGVSETALLTLNGRATEARRSDGVIDDPMAIALADSIDYDFSKFGPTRQDIALRALAFDDQTRQFLRQHPSGTVVALAEGLQTSFWRVSAGVPDPAFRWLTVDLPPIIEIRSRLLPAAPQVSVCAQSALDYSWMDQVDPDNGVFISAEGLLMYLQPEQSLGLIAECARRFPGGRLLFDVPPPWLSKLVRRGVRTSLRYKAPPMPFGLSVSAAADLVNTVPGIRAVRDIPLPTGRGWLFNTLLSNAYRLSFLDSVRPSLTLLEFG
ncbi:class I SAM-dependent methyltransferase [Mycolicibacter longobardus]|uniref:Methyltransferase n=1 Tax=Mycolicibacter longobardus TaxID=1108812 RepID=A0A1X1YDP2_9MYCO|nr:class I SAM-dependent methyltransferase [Mycolicibacter longobardus]MCV7382481.1 class I SAM-dependent methyltransferase [Mycolicibacter longobardus]ORW09155.1 methyltransferase [Mycolicibacter longobardus]